MFSAYTKLANAVSFWIKGEGNQSHTIYIFKLIMKAEHLLHYPWTNGRTAGEEKISDVNAVGQAVIGDHCDCPY